MKKACLLFLTALTSLLLLCSCGNSAKPPLSLRIQSLDGDKYTVIAVLEITRNDGKPLGDITYESAELDVDGNIYSLDFSRLHGRTKDDVAECYLTQDFTWDISGKRGTVEIKDIVIDGTKYPGKWNVGMELNVDTSSKLYKIKPDAACNLDDFIFESVEVTPYTVMVNAKSRVRIDHEFTKRIGIGLEDGEIRNSGSSSGSGGTIPENGAYEDWFLQKCWRTPVDINKVTQLIVDGKPYPFSEIG